MNSFSCLKKPPNIVSFSQVNFHRCSIKKFLEKNVQHSEKSICLFLISCRPLGVYRNRHPEVFLVKGVLKICSKFTGEHPCRSVISVKLLCNFIEITLRHGCSPVNLMYIFRTTFLRIPMDGCFWKVEKRSKHQM